MAQYEAVEPERRNITIVVLKEKLEMSELPKEVKHYMKHNIYVDASDGVNITQLRLVKNIKMLKIFISCIFRRSLLPCPCFKAISELCRVKRDQRRETMT